MSEPLRATIVDVASSVLLGPLEPVEIITSPPLDTYLTGILWPEGQLLDAIEDDQSDGAANDDESEGDATVPGYRLIRPCAIGITFAASADVTLHVSLGTTARYVMIQQAPAVDGGRPKRTFQRRELGYTIELPPGGKAQWQQSEFKLADGTAVNDPTVLVHVRRRIVDDQQVVTVTLINGSIETDDSIRDEVCLFQTQILVKAVDKDGAGAIRARKVLPLRAGDDDARSAALLYRDAVEYAVGHAVAAEWDAPQNRRVSSVRTTWMPSAVVKSMDASGHERVRAFAAKNSDVLRAEWLSREAARAEILASLRAFADCYSDWIIKDLKPRIGEFDGEMAATAGINVERCEIALQRIRAGIETLEKNDHAWRAFCLANAAMDTQANYDAKGDRKAPLRWRPFQLAYFLLVLSSLVDPNDSDRGCVDLLWFPTGGGKTEAYLGLTAFQIFYRRLTDKDRREEGGVDVMMRYTLRLLTVQQFQRAASLISACELMRVNRGDLGDAAISLGLYVGGDATPNRIKDAHTALSEEQNDEAPRSTPRQLLNCPVCAKDLLASCYEMTNGDTDMEIRCANEKCPTYGTPLPVITVDDIIYARPPSLLIGTIDKFAQLPRRQDLGVLFGLNGSAAPGLIIQDELHLISGPLGSMAGLYETVVDLMCTRAGIRPKVIGSTATIGQAARQVRALFDRTVLQFPPSGFDASDSFFAVRDDRPGVADRLYLGVSSAGRSPKFALQATAAAFLEAAQVLLDRGETEAALDAFWTCVLYFNSLRELGGAYVLMQDDVPRQIDFIATRLGASARPLNAEPVELSSRVSSRELPQKLRSLEATLQAYAADPNEEHPQNTVLASNMISVGVDVSRLGLMLVNGQPKSTAEYIQATSRVGRGVHGLIVTLYNFGRPRDVSHFEHFNGYHAALYRSVEATSVTPWAPRARDKALHAVLAAAVRHLATGMSADDAARDFDAKDPEVTALTAAIKARAASASFNIETTETSDDIDAIIAEWTQRSNNARVANKRFLYWKREAPFGKTLPHLMRAAEDGGRSTQAAWPTPNSMREVEPSTAFVLKRIGKNKNG
jgi:hypothetical protein